MKLARLMASYNHPCFVYSKSLKGFSGVKPASKVNACTKVTSTKTDCPSPVEYCEEVNKRAWERNNHDTCTAVKQHAREQYNGANEGCNGQTFGKCYKGD